jgi:hypothetical protein
MTGIPVTPAPQIANTRSFAERLHGKGSIGGTPSRIHYRSTESFAAGTEALSQSADTAEYVTVL